MTIDLKRMHAHLHVGIVFYDGLPSLSRSAAFITSTRHLRVRFSGNTRMLTPVGSGLEGTIKP
jgi:hypothetical protein